MVCFIGETITKTNNDVKGSTIDTFRQGDKEINSRPQNKRFITTERVSLKKSPAMTLYKMYKLSKRLQRPS